MSALTYRFNVGIALLDAHGRLFLGKGFSDGPEIVTPGREWQMPQGGIDAGEDIIAAARRELAEETGITQASTIALSTDWWRYEFPPYAGPAHKLTAFRGQQQRWVVMRFEGRESDIRFDQAGADFQPEFTDWRWAEITTIAATCPAYKQATYGKVADFLNGLNAVSMR
jgi:putative (di)nucleoside polyphosphate hydrolase